MFKSSRPRVPSRAALRILYQLAYISSGTAVGVATLCAEERRRRTQMVQKIADNARRLRQSPRHVQNNGGLVQAEEGVADLAVDGVFVPRKAAQAELSGKTRRRRGDWTARAAYLPSKVRGGYERGVQSGQDHRESKDLDVEPDKHRREIVRDQLARRLKFGMSMRPASSTIAPHSIAGNEQEAILPRATPMIRNNRTSNLAIRRYQCQEGKLVPRGVTEGAQPLGHAESEILSRIDANDRNPALTLAQDVEAFFTDPILLSRDLVHRVNHSSQLLQSAVQYGNISLARSVWLWRRSVGAISDQDICTICSKYASLSAQTDAEEVLEFFEDIFRSKRFQKAPRDLRVYCTLRVYTDSRWDVPSYDDYTYRVYGKHDMSSEHVQSALDSLCNYLLPSDAWWLLQRSRLFNPLSSDSSYVQRLEDRIFHAALQKGQLWCCARIIRKVSENQRSARVEPETLSMMRDLLSAAHDNKQYDAVAYCLDTTRILDSHESYEDFTAAEITCLAIACTRKRKTEGMHELSRTLLKRVPSSRQVEVAEAMTVGRLHQAWRTTRNLTLTNKVFLSTLRWVEGIQATTSDLEHHVRLAMVEILNSAGKPALALEVIGTIDKSRTHSSLGLSLTAISLAKRGSWDEVHQLLGILSRWQSFSFDRDVLRNLNKLLDLFSARHSADETWEFVTGLMTTLKFRPNMRTTMIMLNCFVTAQALPMIPAWLRLMRTVNDSFKLLPSATAKILEQFYYAHRPPHVLMFRFIRTLLDNSPSLKPASFIRLLESSTAYDARQKSNRKIWLVAHQNLALLEQAQGQVPEPVANIREARAYKAQQDVAEGAPAESDDQASHFDAASPSSVSVDQQWECLVEQWNTIDDNEVEPGLSTGGYQPFSSGDAIQDIAELDHDSLPLEDFPDASFEPGSAANAHRSLDHDMKPDQDVATDSKESVTADMESSSISSRRRHDEQHLKHVMVKALSLKQYEKAVNLYKRHVDISGIPFDQVVLEVAVQASLELRKGDSSEAEQLLGAAQEAGMEVSAAVDQILMQRLWSSTSQEKKDFRNLRSTVLDHYRTNEEKGIRIKNHLALTTANVLIDNHLPIHGLSLLRAVHESAWAMDRPFTIEALTITLKAFIAMQSRNGVRDVVVQVLKENIRIDYRFLDTLKSGAAKFGNHPTCTRTIRRYYEACVERRRQQRRQVKRLGWQLVSILQSTISAPEKTTVTSSTRRADEAALLGKTELVNLPTDITDEELNTERQNVQQAAEGDRATIEMKRLIHVDPTSSLKAHEQRAIDDEDWLDQYRISSKHPLIMDEQPASFRYCLHEQDRDWTEPDEATLHNPVVAIEV